MKRPKQIIIRKGDKFYMGTLFAIDGIMKYIQVDDLTWKGRPFLCVDSIDLLLSDMNYMLVEDLFNECSCTYDYQDGEIVVLMDGYPLSFQIVCHIGDMKDGEHPDFEIQSIRWIDYDPDKSFEIKVTDFMKEKISDIVCEGWEDYLTDQVLEQVFSNN